MAEQKRIGYIDSMRGVTMLLVVYAHVRTFGYGPTDTFSFNNVFTVFRMPLFFFISGWVLYKPGRVWDWPFVSRFLEKKFRIQIIPTVVFMLLFAHLFHYSFAAGINSGPKLGYWFTITLFFYFLFYSLSQLAARGVCRYLKLSQGGVNILILSISVFLFLISFSHVLFDKSIYARAVFDCLSIEKWRYYVFFVTGTFVRQYYDRFNRLMDGRYSMAAVLAVFVSLMFVKSDTPRLLEPLWFVAASLSGLVIVLTYFRHHERQFSEGLLARTLQHVGRRTLDIYLLHYFFLPRDLRFMSDFLSVHPRLFTLEFFFTAFLALLVLAVCLFVSQIIRLSPVLAKWLLGVSEKR